MGTPFRVAVDALGSFSSSDALAAYLHGEGIRGVPGDDYACPLSIWLTRKCELPLTVKVTSAFAFDVVSGDSVPLPEVAATFVEWFDSEAYPELVE